MRVTYQDNKVRINGVPATLLRRMRDVYMAHRGPRIYISAHNVAPRRTRSSDKITGDINRFYEYPTSASAVVQNI